jgi:hypothetical protein
MNCAAINCLKRFPNGCRSFREIRVYFIGFAVLMSLISLPAGSQTLTEVQKAWLTKADRHEKGGWIYLHVEGSAKEIGFQHGYLLSKEIMESIKDTRLSWEYETAMEWDWLVKKSTAIIIPKVDAENLEEMEGISDGLKAAGYNSSRDEIVCLNAWIELRDYWWPNEFKKMTGNVKENERESCSSFIAVGSMTSNGDIVLGHNTMTSYNEAMPNVVIDLKPEKGHRILMQTTAGLIHSGTDFFITDAGLVGSETTIGGFSSFDEKGIPEFSRMRRATQDAGSIDEWCDIMKKGNNGGYANAWLIGDINTKEIARLELGLQYIGFERKKDGFFTGSNVAVNMKILRFETVRNETDISHMGVSRKVRWNQLMKQYVGKIDSEKAKQFEADHFDTFLKQEIADGRTLCGHGELQREPAGWPSVPYGPAGTVDAKVVDSKMARNMSFTARWGSGCGMAFDAAKFLEDHPQFDWMKDILKSRPSEEWTVFNAGEK